MRFRVNRKSCGSGINREVFLSGDINPAAAPQRSIHRMVRSRRAWSGGGGRPVSLWARWAVALWRPHRASRPANHAAFRFFRMPSG